MGDGSDRGSSHWQILVPNQHAHQKCCWLRPIPNRESRSQAANSKRKRAIGLARPPLPRFPAFPVPPRRRTWRTRLVLVHVWGLDPWRCGRPVWERGAAVVCDGATLALRRPRPRSASRRFRGMRQPCAFDFVLGY
jgi:hypothetical protein